VGVACSHDGCEEVITLGDVEKHTCECAFRLVTCEHCKFQIPFNQKEVTGELSHNVPYQVCVNQWIQ